MRRMGSWTLAALALCAVVGAADPQPAAPGYHVVKKIELGGDGGWDYLTCDPEAHRLYIARATRVMVVDLEQGKLAGEVADTPGVHGVALVSKRGRGFASNGRDASVTVFDLKTLKAVNRIKVGQGPDFILFDPASGRVFTFNAGSKDATAIDAETEMVVGTVPLGGKPEAAVSDEKGRVYVNIEDKGEIIAFDARTLAVAQHWPVAPAKDPIGLAIDRAKKRLFCTCGSGVMVVMDAESGRVLASPPIGKGTDAAGFDPETGLAFSSNRDGTLTVVREETPGNFTVAENVKTQALARTMALDPKTHTVYLVTAKPKEGQPRGYEPGSFVVLVVGK
jgi:DNA-binding beta-propeller fold protein YncE